MLAAHTIRDGVAFNASAAKLREPTFSVIDRLQHFHPSVQVEAAMLAALVLSQGAGLDPHELMSRARRQLPDVEALDERIRAMRDYAKGELR